MGWLDMSRTCSMFKNFYDHIDFDPDECLSITKTIINLTYLEALIYNLLEAAAQEDDV